MAPAVKGNYESNEALKKILNDSGLEANMEGTTAIIKRERVAPTKTEAIQLDQVQVRAKRFYEIGPLPGLGLTKEQIPGNVQSITAKEIKESHSLSITDLMNKKLQSVNVNDYQGNPFQMDVTYRGFTAGPQIGTPQGLSVFFDGIRVNEPFGDVVNWDMIPMNALASVDVFPGSNPIFGLNTLGGAFTVKTKDGFNNEGIDAEVLSGSFGRNQLQVEGGWNNGTVALFGAGNFFLEDGWRENSPSKVNQFFGKASYRGDKLDLNLSTLIVGTDLVGNGLLPSEMYAQDRNASFTSEDKTKNRLQQFQLSSSYFVNDNFTVTGQVYRRNSKRHQIGGDVMTDYNEELAARRLPNAGEEHTCVLLSENQYGLPNYIVIPINVTAGEDIFASEFMNDFFTGFGDNPTPGILDLEGKYAPNVNVEIPTEIASVYKGYIDFNKDLQSTMYDRSNPNRNNTGADMDYTYSYGTVRDASYRLGTSYFGGNPGGNAVFAERTATIPGENIVSYGAFNDDSFYYSKQGTDDIKNYIIFLPAINRDKCQQDLGTDQLNRGPYVVRLPDDDPYWPGGATLVDGALYGQPGYIQGTPTAVINDNRIDQIVDGASIQFNWNFEKHKFMVGASIDAASAEYSNAAQMGFLDAERNAYLDPAQAHPQFTAAFIPLRNNDFSGTNTTKSVYFSETWTPNPAWNFSLAGRYNQTKTKNEIASRYGFFNYGLGDIKNIPDSYAVCTDIDGDCLAVERNFRPRELKGSLNPAETEKFSFYSFNPSLGGTWQAKENLNVFANWAKGTRTPSVVELGCALDKTPGSEYGYSDENGNLVKYRIPKSLEENRECRLPTTLSGDPFLPQIKATTYDIGLRGTIGENLQWNLGAYQTDLKDDIYFVTVGQGSGFFDSIGKTRRRGIETGLSGKVNKWGFSVNYSLTDATFENSFLMLSEDNSSARRIDPLGTGVIEVEKGNRMPGVALHNLNATVSYDVTDKWIVGLTGIAHSESFLRGNENNAHRKGVIRFADLPNEDGLNILQPLPATNNPGKISGYATFNFQTSYKLNSEWTASMFINNLFDREYFSAGRLGRNPFSPSIAGAIGPSGYNHNSNDWLSTNFIAPSAPRGIWFSLNWRFDPNKK